MPDVLMHGVIINENAIEKFYPINSNFPQFNHFRLRPVPNPSNAGEFIVQVAACSSNGNEIEILEGQEITGIQRITFSTPYVPNDVKIQIEIQLDKVRKDKFLGIPIRTFKILSLDLTPRHYIKNPPDPREYIQYKVKVKRKKI
jgi:hypothetical protein